MMEISFKLGLLKKIKNRILWEKADSRVHSDLILELKWHLRSLRSNNVEAIYRRNYAFQNRIPDQSFQDASAIIGFDTSSWILAKRCANANRPLYLERTTDHPSNWQRLQWLVHNNYPEWQEKPQPRYSPLVEAEAKEHEAAHRIVVGSTFVADSLSQFGVDSNKIVVNPYGANWESFSPPQDRSLNKKHRPFRFLFAGNISARKGVPVLLGAWKSLLGKVQDSELWLVGTLSPHLKPLIPSLKGLYVKDRVSRSEIGEIYHSADVLVLPSFSEGFGLVMIEAIASGLSVITTPNTGGIDLYHEGGEDIISLVDVGNSDALAEQMLRCFDHNSDKDRTDKISKLKSKFSWSAYGNRWSKLLENTPAKSGH